MLSSRNSDLARVDDIVLQTAQTGYSQGLKAEDECRDKQYR